MRALNNDQTFDEPRLLSTAGELELVVQYPRYNFIMLSIAWKFDAEAATGGVSKKTVFLKISQFSQKNTCVGVSF